MRLPSAALIVAAAALACVVYAGHPAAASAQESRVEESLSELLSEAPTSGISPIGRVEKISLGSRGATVTLEGGEEILLDFSGLAGGAGGGTNYVGWGMLLFGLSVATRLLATVTRLFSPLAARSRRRRRYEDD